MKTFNDLRKINVNEFIEKKGNLSYLSWTWAVDTLLQNDPTATWVFHEPKRFGDTLMVFCSVTAMGKTMNMHLPVMDNRNNAVKDPDARKVSDAMMRCLAKCIATFGIGLYIYAGEDVPSEEAQAQIVKSPGDFVCTFGTMYKNKTIKEIGATKLQAYIRQLNDVHAKENKPIPQYIASFISEANQFLNNWENFKS